MKISLMILPFVLLPMWAAPVPNTIELPVTIKNRGDVLFYYLQQEVYNTPIPHWEGKTLVVSFPTFITGSNGISKRNPTAGLSGDQITIKYRHCSIPERKDGFIVSALIATVYDFHINGVVSKSKDYKIVMQDAGGSEICE